MKEICVSKADLSMYNSNVTNFIDILKKQRFKNINVSCLDDQVMVKGTFHSGYTVCFEVGEENVGLTNTCFYAKDSQEKLVDLVFALYHLD